MITAITQQHFLWAEKYIAYLDLKQKGLKKHAQKILTDFFEDFQKQTISERRRFINSVYENSFLSGNYSLYLPQNLADTVEPEIYRWLTEEPRSA